MLSAVEIIHNGTAIYTNPPEIDKLLDQIEWPRCDDTLLDPACGDGNMIIAAIERMVFEKNDSHALRRISGIEFHEPSANAARQRVSALLIQRGWDKEQARQCAESMIETRDFLLDPPSGQWDVIIANPPYWRRARLPESYRRKLDAKIPGYARGDLLHAYLDTMLQVLDPSGRLALITSDRWLGNAGATTLRQHIGKRLKISQIQRLDAKSAFHRPKERARNTPPRVHAVAILLGHSGRPLSGNPFSIEGTESIEGVRLNDIANIRLAPWMGPDGIFLLDRPDAIPGAETLPCVMPRGIYAESDQLRPPTRWALVTTEQQPAPAVMAHFERTMKRMPARGRRTIKWLPPERIGPHFPHDEETVLVPRIAKKLRAVILPPGMLPVNHSLVVISSEHGAKNIKAMLDHPIVQQQANALASPIEGGYRSYTATLLKQLVIPQGAMPPTSKATAAL